MQTEYKYLKFVLLGHKPRTDVWGCFGTGGTSDMLGTVEWYGRWRQYCLFNDGDVGCVFSGDCLDDISHFLKQVNAAHKAKQKELASA